MSVFCVSDLVGNPKERFSQDAAHIAMANTHSDFEATFT